jgi:hypothetical protein
MSGIFATWQPRYAEAGLPTFPVDADRKAPMVKGYLKGGLRAAAAWRDKHASAAALGIACGPRSGLTVLDIDAPDERLLADSMDKFGQSPVVIRTASGKFHAWYRHSGEPRKIRSIMPGLPVDLLGAGGMAIAPPSRSERGEYAFLIGSLADVPFLPRMRCGNLDDTCSTPDASANADMLADAAPIGQRNNLLFRACLAAARSCTSEADLENYARTANGSGMSEPLPDSELLRIVSSSWGYHQAGRNWAGSGQQVVLSHAEIDLYADAPDALLLLTVLRRHHWGRDFVVANAMAETMPGGGWRRQRFAAARALLEVRGALHLVRPHSKATGPALYRFTNEEIARV